MQRWFVWVAALAAAGVLACGESSFTREAGIETPPGNGNGDDDGDEGEGGTDDGCIEGLRVVDGMVVPCGGDDGDDGDDGGGGEGEGPCEDVTIRLLGVAQGGVSAMHATVGSVTASLVSGGTLPLEGAAVGTTLDLSTDLQSYPLGAFWLADATGKVRATVSFSSVHVAIPSGEGPIDVCTFPFTFVFDPAQVVAPRCHVLVKLDVAASILSGAGGVTFLPQYRVAF